MSRWIKFDDAVKVMACEMYAEAQSQGYDVDGIEDFMSEAKAWLNDAPSIDIEPNSSEIPNNCEELNAYRECVKSRSFWDSKHCDGCYFEERCPFDEPRDEPQTCSFSDCDNFKNPDYERCIECKRKQIKLKTEQTEREGE